LGKSGRAILAALIAGQSDPEKPADLAQGSARKKRAELIEALHGRIRPHHRGLLKVRLTLVATLEQTIADIDTTVGKVLASVHESARLLSTMPGISDLTAHVIVAEIGVDMTRFASDAHLRSWARYCPRSDESAGKRHPRAQGRPLAKTTLVSAAWAAVRVKESYLQAQSTACAHGAAPKKPSSRSPLRCSPPPTTCSKTASSTKTSVPATSRAVTGRRSSCVWFDGSMIWDVRSKSSHKPLDKRRKT
jgi:transposase